MTAVWTLYHRGPLPWPDVGRVGVSWGPMGGFRGLSWGEVAAGDMVAAIERVAFLPWPGIGKGRQRGTSKYSRSGWMRGPFRGCEPRCRSAAQTIGPGSIVKYIDATPLPPLASHFSCRVCGRKVGAVFAGRIRRLWPVKPLSSPFWPALLALGALLSLAHGGAIAETVPVRMLVPGFTVRELPVQLSNQNNLRFAPDGTLTSLGYDGRVWRLIDTDGDGLEDRAEVWWDRSPLTVPLGMCWSTDGLYVSSSGKVSRLRDTDGDNRADEELVVSRDWPAKDTASGNVDATAVTLDAEGRVYFGLVVQNYANAFRLKRRGDLTPVETDWLKSVGRWREAGGADDEFSLYDLSSRRGTIQRFDPRTGALTTLATGIRVPVGLAFNAAGDLFNTDQEGETWMPDGNPLDELNHIQMGKHYGFPPRHERWLPGVTDEPPVLGLGPQHQSACGLVFNEPRGPLNPDPAPGSGIPLPSAPAQGRFGPAHWAGEVLIAGQSRGRIWSASLARTPTGYFGRSRTIARLSLLTVDLAISPKGALYVCCHSGPPDWGTGPQGPGRIFQITHDRPDAPQPIAIWPESATQVRVRFDRPIHPPALAELGIGFGEYVSAGDRHEVLRPPYAVVEQQAAVPRARLAVVSRRLEDGGRLLVLETDPHPLPVQYVFTMQGLRSAAGSNGSGDEVELEYDLTEGCRSLAHGTVPGSPEVGAALVAWAPPARASSGTSSRPPEKPDGDWENGRELFFGRLQCAKCHRIQGEGGSAGPDLSNLIHRDIPSIVRDIREPSATLHPEYVTHLVETRSGESHAGFLRPSSTPAEVVLADVEGRVQRWSREDVLRVVPAEGSLMPTGLLDTLEPAQLRDLLTFLAWARPVRTRDEVARLPQVPKGTEDGRPIHLILVASKQDHGPGQHDYPAWQTKWQRLLDRAARKTVVEKAWEWPTAEQWARADAVVFYTWNHDWSASRYAALDAFQARGGGVVVLHSAVIADKEPLPLAERLGLSAHPGISYRHMPFELELTEEPSPLTRGLPRRMRFLDEPYWPLVGDPTKIRLLGWARVDGERRPLVWTHERGPGRVFGSILGHYFWTLDDPYYRLLVLRGIAWAAKADPEALVDLTALEAAVE